MSTRRRPTSAAARPATAAPAQAVAAPPKARSLRVRAIRLGYYGDKRQRVGDVFDLTNEKHFSATWMERVDGKTPAKTTTSREALAGQMGPAGQQAANAANPLGD